ncbi:hypothetical protein QJS04_geneDACA008490 [Acorus gramineus]|uniref:Uncharacterized protein n=1 Tax=Acorus gramineus TaxID=55184 RepID=A0AAV9AJY2_ACOGR|nr:hypothetical protein QJS04_geneDACA008490 [Acorus gramineus]
MLRTRSPKRVQARQQAYKLFNHLHTTIISQISEKGRNARGHLGVSVEVSIRDCFVDLTEPAQGPCVA